MNALLRTDGSPDLTLLQTTYNRSGCRLSGGTDWLDAVRFCQWANQSEDGLKHDLSDDADGAAVPWDGASDCRPMVVDGIINERAGVLTEAFWRAMTRPGAGTTEAGEYAVALADHLIWTTLYGSLVREVELAAQYILHYGWCVLAPRWRREIGLRRQTLTMETVVKEAEMAAAAIEKLKATQRGPAEAGTTNMQGPAKAGTTNMGPAEAGTTNMDAQKAQLISQLTAIAQLPTLILDPSLEEQAVDWFVAWYEGWVLKQLPEELRARAPGISRKTAQRVVRELRADGRATAPIPYLCQDAPEVCALKPWEEVLIPPELTDEQEVVFQRELVSDAELDSRIITEDYDSQWVEEAKKFRGSVQLTNLPVATDSGGNALSRRGGVLAGRLQSPDPKSGLIEIVHAVYRASDSEGIPGVYMTTFHAQVVKKDGTELYAKHGLMEDIHGQLPYVAAVNEWWTRAVTGSRSVPEISASDQNLVKGTFDAIMDRTSITVLPPVNVYESPTGAVYKFGPARQNYVRAGREPQFMAMPSGQGLVDGVKMHEMLKARIDNYHGLLAETVPPARVQASQSTDVRRFLLAWTKALQMMLCLCQRNMADAEFAEITGAPVGWLDAHRDQAGALACVLHFDVRELDPELFIEQIKAVNTLVFPNDMLGVVSRSNWPKVMMRGINPQWARELILDKDDATTQMRAKTAATMTQIFDGQEPQPIDKKDPTAGQQLKDTMEIVSANPMYRGQLTDEALIALYGQQAPMAVQNLQRQPNERVSAILLNWVKNLQFWAQKQPEAAESGRTGTKPIEA